MISPMEKFDIINLHLKGHSQRFIAKKTGTSRKTVGKYINEYECQRRALHDLDQNDNEAIHEVTEKIVAPPAYDSSNRKPTKWNAHMDATLDEILSKEAEKQRILGQNKQALTKRQIHQKMREAGHDIGYTTVCAKVNERKEKPKEAFIAQSHPFGERFEYDFGEVKLLIAGKLHTMYLAVATLPASGARFAWLYANQTASVFVDSHVRLFGLLGGVPRSGVYDNMRNVVARFVGRNEKQITQNLRNLASYYGFSVNVTNCFSPEEKGHVESSVKVIRNAAFALRYEFDSLDEAQGYLDDILATLNADKCLEEEISHLLPAPLPYEAADIRQGVVVDKYSCVTVNATRYSVPDALVGKPVVVKAYPNEVAVCYKGRVVARHSRPLEEGGMCLDIRHVTDTLRRKPGALADSQALKSLPEFKRLFDEHYSHRPKEFIQIIHDHKGEGLCEIYGHLCAHVGKSSSPRPKYAPNAIEKATRAQIERLSCLIKEVGYAS